MKKICFFILLLCLQIANTKAQNRILSIDLNKPKGKFNTMFKECIGAGRANEGLRIDWQEQLKQTKLDCGFKYIRMHGLLHDDMGVYQEDRNGKPIYNYQYIDVLHDKLLAMGIKPFVELGFMPAALTSGKQTIFWWKGNVTPPKDYNKWQELIKNLTAHFTERYGAEEVKTWYFEVWNEPNLKDGFWTGTQEEYFKLYKYAVAGIKEVNKAYKVGGPATAGAAWVPEMIAYCHKNNVPIDFVSTHTYGVNQGFLDEFGTSGTVLNKDKASITGDVTNSRKQISASAFPNLELHYTEWSSSYTPSDPLHDSYHEAAYILEKLKQTGNAANSMSYWVFTDIFEEAGPRFTPFHGGFGLMNYQGIKKPAYHAYAFLNKMGETELENKDLSSWACKKPNGDFQLLLWDFTYTLEDSVNNQQYYIRDLPSKTKGKTTVNLSGLKPGKYTMNIYKIGYRNNDPYTAYFHLNKPNQLTLQQEKFLKEKSSGKPAISQQIQIAPTGKFTKELSLNENDVILVELKKI